jgi:phosphatidylglycerophosphate synthase
VLDVAVLDPHVRGLRRDLRPLWFPAPGSARARRLATEVVLQSAQKAILDIPAYVHAPIENALIRWLCRTPITPNQLTLATNVLAFGVTALFALGRIGAGTVGALVVGVLDGLDGKQARVKVETSAVGEWEHVADYVYEFSWWAALAWHFAGTGEVRSALFLFGLMWGADLAERIARYLVKHGTGREVETLSRVDVWFRLVGGRRNIFVWIFAAAVVLGRPAEGFVVFTAWGILSSLFQVVRAPMALLGRRAPIT